MTAQPATTPSPTPPTIEAFDAEAVAVSRTLHEIPADRWHAEGLGTWTIAELTAHLLRAAGLTATYLAQGTDATDAAQDRVSYFRFDLAAAADGVAARAKEDAAASAPEGLPGRFDDARRRTLGAVADLPTSRLMPTFRGPMAVEEYLATRVLELTVHHVDLCRALGRRAATTRPGLAVTVDILEALLDGDRPGTLDDASFMLAATGRDLHPDPRLPLIV